MNNRENLLEEIDKIFPLTHQWFNNWEKQQTLEGSYRDLLTPDTWKDYSSLVPWYAAVLSAFYSLILFFFAQQFIKAILLPLILFFGLKTILWKLHTKNIERKNLKIEKYNASIRPEVSAQMEELELENMDLTLKIKESPIPEKYTFYPTLKVIRDLVVNHRADSLKEAINLYEKERSELKQEEIYQKYNHTLDRVLVEQQRTNRKLHQIRLDN